MIKKKTNAYEQIKQNIAKLALIQEATGISPIRLINIFLNHINMTENGEEANPIESASAYKYFYRHAAEYKKRNFGSQNYKTILEIFQTTHLTKEYFGESYEEVALEFKAQEKALKDFVREAFKAVFPITVGMNPAQVAARNQRLGKISVNMWIGDILHYDFFHDAPGFMMSNVEKCLQRVDLYVLNLLNDDELATDIMKLSTNQKLEQKLQPKTQQVKTKVKKI